MGRRFHHPQAGAVRSRVRPQLSLRMSVSHCVENLKYLRYRPSCRLREGVPAAAPAAASLIRQPGQWPGGMLHFQSQRPCLREVDLEPSFQTHFFSKLSLCLRFSIHGGNSDFLTATASLSRRQSLKVAAYAAAMAFLVLFFFICAGQHLLEALKIPMTSFQLAGSSVLLLFGVKLVLGQVAEEVSPFHRMLRWPSARSIRLQYRPLPARARCGRVLLTDNNVRTIGEQAITTSHLAISLAIVFCVLALSKWIFSVVGRPGIEVMGRVSGLILASIAVHNMIIAAKLSSG